LDKVSTGPSSIGWDDDEKMIGTDEEGEREEAASTNNNTSNMETELNGNSEVVGVDRNAEMDGGEARPDKELDGDVRVVDNLVDFEIDLAGQ
jgi:hypothetical protein